MGRGASKRKRSVADQAVEKYGNKNKRKTQQAEQTEAKSASEKHANIESNLFHQIVIQSDVSPKEKKDAVARALVYNEDKRKGTPITF